MGVFGAALAPSGRKGEIVFQVRGDCAVLDGNTITGSESERK